MSLRSRIQAFLQPPRDNQEPAVPQNQLDDMSLAFRSLVRGTYDSKTRTPENVRHWQWADHLAADASLNPSVRIALRSQSRYELQENNSYGRGITNTVVTDTIGTGPRLQVGQWSHSVNQEVEKSFWRWAQATGYSDKLTTVRTAKLVDGESVIRFINNLRVEDPVQLDVQLIECDQLSSPRFEQDITPTYVDGVHLDRFGNPFAYDILQQHPGNTYWTQNDFFAFDTYPIEQIIHTYNVNRPGQHRGVPEFAPALPLFAFLRRFTLATVSAAETAANVTQVISTDAPIPEELESEYAAATFEKFMDTIPSERNSATVLPNMWKLQQFAAEHPTTTYGMFKRELVAEIGRCLGVPVNVASGDSGPSNFASAKFDWLGYERTVFKEQNRFDRSINDKVFGEWILEASLVGSIPRRAASQVLAWDDEFGRRGLVGRIEHSWNWDGMRDANEKDAANAQKIRLQNGSTHRAREYAEQNLDVEVEDQKAAETFGVDVETYREWVRASVFTNGNLLTQGEAEGAEPVETVETEEAEEAEETSDTTQEADA